MRLHTLLHSILQRARRPTSFTASPPKLATRPLGILAAFLIAATCSNPLLAGNWPGWRGPTGMGTTDEKDLPLKWNGKTGEGILWKAPLKGTTGHSSPIVWNDRVLLTSAAAQTREQEEKKEVPEHYLACYQANDGKLLWRATIPQGKEVVGYSIYATPTPLTDGQAVYCWFGSAVLAAVDFDGKILWRQERPGAFVLNPGLCQSPILFDDTIILSVDQARGQGYFQAIDKKTGAVKWDQKRPNTAYCNATPLLLEVNGKTQLIAACENSLRGIDPATGELIWSCKAGGFGESPVASAGIVVVDKGGNESAMAVDPTGQGDVSKTHVKWRVDKSPGDYASPVISGDLVYKASAEGEILCRKLSTGEEVFREKLDKVSKLASPIAATDGRVYFLSTGTSYVINAGPKLEVLGGGDLGGAGNGSSPAVANGRIFVRDFDYLWCIGTK